MRYILSYVYLTLLIVTAFFAAENEAKASETPLTDTGYVNAQMIASVDVAEPGSEIYVALRTLIDPKWHTYWRNPGDSGEPVRIDWDDNVQAGEIIWPIPYAIMVGEPEDGLTNYGFEGDVLFPVKITVPANLKAGDSFTVSGRAGWLVCYDICVPEDLPFSLDIVIGDTAESSDWNPAILAALSSAPQDRGTVGGAELSNGQFQFSVTGGAASRTISDIHFFPYDGDVIVAASKQNIVIGSSGIAGATAPGYGLSEALTKDVPGVLTFTEDGTVKGEIVLLKAGAMVDIGEISSGTLTGAADMPATGVGSSILGSETTLWGAILGAFLGGIILNLMPCVFPILSMKALGFARIAHEEKRRVRWHGWVYTFGVFTAFAMLIGVLVILKNLGQNLGWGFQLQNPAVVGGLALLLFAIGLNLLGMFEVGTKLQGAGGELTAAGGATGTFFTGMLAVVVATPCTAPFMATAIGFALAKPLPVLVAVFAALAIGFALPFLLLSYAPKILKALPKPGPWMVRFKEILAFPMFAAAIWLVWVVVTQAGDIGLIKILSSMLILALGIWLLARRPSLSKALGVAAVIGALVLPFTIKTSVNAVPLAGTSKQAWSPEAVDRLRAEGQAVFVDFTASWCITCKLNEGRVLNKPAIKQVFAETNTAFLVADWTSRDDAIASELARYGRAGVPLYLYFPSGNNPVRPVVFPQILTQDMIRSTLMGE